ncbi:MAG: efflux RND transporter periplasmic adaptor subunit [Proteobacteria bacterium]|nr:efflux RND transporter periplasmic adaptor subunit [Pseudomonadota bacterium]
MKWSLIIIFMIALFITGINYRHELIAYYLAQPETAMQHAEKHLDPSYVCPMHGNIIKSEPGSCPICGMDLVEQVAEAETTNSQSSEKKILYWVAPMDANYRRDKPGQSPMGMDLVPVYAESDEVDVDVVKINSAVQQNIGVKTTKVSRGDLWRKIKTVGYVDYDEDLISHIHIRTEGWIEKLQVRAVGDRVKKDQLLMTIYSPELIRAQQDFIRVLSHDGQSLSYAAERNLIALGMSKRQIKVLRKTKKVTQTINLYAPQNGVIKRLSVRDGMYVTPSNELMSIVDLSSVWIQTNVFESQSSWIKEGQDMQAVLTAYPQQQWQGKVDYIYADLDPVTRSLKVRLQVANKDFKLKKEMYAEVYINAGQIKNALIIPKQAVIRDGQDERVIVSLGQGSFRAQLIKTDAEIDDQIVVLSGLKEGDEIVTSAQFLIDSEASLKASFARMK